MDASRRTPRYPLILAGAQDINSRQGTPSAWRGVNVGYGMWLVSDTSSTQASTAMMSEGLDRATTC